MTNDFKRILAEMSEIMQKKYCLVPGCKCKRIIKAHTVQNKGGLSAISKDGLVCTFTRNPQIFVGLLEADSKIRSGFSMDGATHYWQEPERIGHNVASTITGFCSEHDRTVFAPIEVEEFLPTDQQIRLFALRCLAYELYRKEVAAKEQVPELTKKLSTDDRWNEIIDIQHQGTILGMEMARSIFNELYFGLNNESDIKLDYVLFELNQVPEIVYSFSRFVNMDMAPVTPEMIEKRDFQWITCSCFYKNEKGFILFSWNHEHKYPRLFIELVLRNMDPGNLIANLFFLFAENVYFSPTWWDSLTVSKRIAIEKEIITLYPDVMRILVEKPRRIVEWDLTHISNCDI